MDYIEFDENELRNPDVISKRLLECSGEDDPTSIYYKRKLIRPSINWKGLIIHTATPIVLSLLSFMFTKKLRLGTITALSISFLEILVYVTVFFKKGLICLIHIYQYFAPRTIRMKCRFEPSCSEYMVLSIEKYGVFQGIRKGLSRLKRCNRDNGGYDFP